MPQRIAITGSTGLIGSHVRDYFLSQNPETVFRCVRPQTHKNSEHHVIFWDPDSRQIDKDKLEGMDAVIHLAGANIAKKRWTPAYKQIIWDSRVDSTRFLVDTFRVLERPPKVFVCASAISSYGFENDTDIKDGSVETGQGFLADVCQAWEAEAYRAAALGIRTVMLRFGVVLSLKGGMLKAMLPAFKMGLGTVLGDGSQEISWIAAREIPLIVKHIIEDQQLNGPVNCVAPQVVTNRQFSKMLAGMLHRPCLFRAPAWVLKLIAGELAQEVLLRGKHAEPRKLIRSGYSFCDEDLKSLFGSFFR